jgi:DNA mismatch repair protein MutS2
MPSPLQHSSARVLELPLFLELLRGYAQSPLGQQRIDSLEPCDDRVWIEWQQGLTSEIGNFLRSGGRFDFSGLYDPAVLLDKSRIHGAILDSLEIRDLLLILERAEEWRSIVLNPPSGFRAQPPSNSSPVNTFTGGNPWPAVSQLSAGMADFGELLRFFRNKIAPDGTLDDRASPELVRIRREIEKQKRTIQDSLRSFLRRLAGEGTVQDELVTIRGERFVIPVKSEQKRRVQGVVHGVSSSGQTVFVEPLETIDQNNELVRLVEEEQEETRRILVEMTRRLGERAVEIRQAIDVLAELELQFAKARFSADYQCVPARILGSPQVQASAPGSGSPVVPSSLVLRAARHPLLERNLRARNGSIVPITVELEAQYRQLVITGPNTGGKTVALKTVGLLALMAQAGVPVPAERAELPVFSDVLADIGDYQSIEQNLSTFSAHVTNIDFIARTAGPGSLVLLDELGSATDPEEGAALAVAIAEQFRRLEALSVISTHHTSLKVYAANASGVLNAAVGFNEQTLQPTYDLQLGVPGASSGINIAQRLGLQHEIVERARERMGTQTRDISNFLDQLHSGLRQVESERAALRLRELEVEREKQRLNLEGLKEQKQRIRELDQKLESLLRDFEYRIRQAIAEVQDRAAATKLSKDADRRIARLRREFREQFDQSVVAHTTGADRGDVHAQPHILQVLEGDTVKLKSLGRAAIVRRKLPGDQLEIEAGIMKMRVPLDDVAEVISRASNNPVAAARSKGVSVRLENDDLNAPTEINVIGQNVDDATRVVEKFVDRAFLAGLPRVRIVHGSGMGILRKALRAYLQSHPHVATVSEPSQNEGGAGATVVDLRT